MKNFIFYIFYIFIFVACKSKITPKETQETVLILPHEKLEVSSQTLNNWQESLDQHFQKISRYSNFNGNVLIARKGTVIYTGSFGVKDLESKDSLNIKSLFQIASVSKTFTAMATLKLVDEGKLKLDQKLEDLFKGFPYLNITIGDLLSHRSGLPNYLVVTEKDWKDADLKSNEDLLKFFIKKKPKPLGSPNRSFSYNNSNYAMLALVIEKVSGMSYEDYLQKNIFDPLRMEDTYIFSKKNTDLPIENLTSGYLRKNTLDKMTAVDGIVGDKNIYSTVEDLLKWERANSHPVIFSQAELDSSVVGRSNERPGRKNYGYGWRLLDDPEKGKMVFHNGWWHGYTSVFYRNPSDETVIIILSNIFNRSTYKIQPVWDILYGSGNSKEDDFNEE